MATKQDKTPDKVAEPKTGLVLLREPFPPHQISKLPKPTKAQTEAVRNDFKQGIRCAVCGTWHHPKVVHLDYVGHAALTDRLLDCDPEWNWEPVATNEDGTPKFDALGGLWIRLTVCGVTRLGYGHADSKKGGDAIKEVIGDALRNAAMRFGAALDLWHKGQLHPAEDAGPTEDEATEPAPKQRRQWEPGQHAAAPPEGETPFDAPPPPASPADASMRHEEAVFKAIAEIDRADGLDELANVWRILNSTARDVVADQRVIDAKEKRKTKLSEQKDAA